MELPYMSNLNKSSVEMRQIKVKVPSGKTLRTEGDGGVSPIKALTIQEQEFVERSEASERKADEIAKTSKALGKNQKTIFRPLRNWNEVELNGETISLRNRERAKDFLRLLWMKNAKCRSKAITVHKQFRKPSSLFKAGELFIKHNTDYISVKSDLGKQIQRVYRECVGVVKAKKGKGVTRYFLRAFQDSDKI